VFLEIGSFHQLRRPRWSAAQNKTTAGSMNNVGKLFQGL
jgi:hypothetical protein